MIRDLLLLGCILLRTKPALTKPTVSPNDTVVLAGHPTVLRCSANNLRWTHTLPESIEWDVYYNTTITPEYKKLGFDGNETHLIIANATDALAGKYTCEDNAEDNNKSVADLIVIEKLPECSVNMGAFVGPNNCSMSPDKILLTCSVSYSGNREPKLKLTKMGENSSLPENCTSDTSSITCYLAVQPDYDLNGSVYICQTTERASEEQYNCTTEPIIIINISSSEESQLTTLPINYTVKCTVNNNLPCTYKWVWYEKFGDDESRTIESHGDVLTAKKPGLHRCEAKCILRNQTCRFFPKHVLVIPSESIAEQNADPPASPASPESSEKENFPFKGLFILEVLHFTIFVCYLFAQLCTWRRRTIAQVFIPTTDEDRTPTNDKDSQTEVCDDMKTTCYVNFC